MAEKQVKSKQRVADHGEVFTSEREVNAMLDLVKQETERIDSRFLEPACGTGNFLAEVLRRKLAVVQRRYGKSPADYEKYAVVAVTSIYGVELLPDNTEECQHRLFEIWDEAYTANCKQDSNDQCREAVRFILQRTHPFVEALANHVLETALDPLSGDAVRYPAARRCGAIRAKAVDRRTTLLLLRFRYHIIQTQNNVERPLLAEDCRLLAYTGSPENAVWLDEAGAENLLAAQPDGNIAADQATDFIERVIGGFDLLRSRLDQAAIKRGRNY